MAGWIIHHRSCVSVVIFLANVPRQQSLAGRAGGSHGLRAKALGLLFFQQALCLNGGMSDPCSSKQPTGQRLAGRACSPGFLRCPICRGSSLAVKWLRGSSCWDNVLSGGPWQSLSWENHPSLQTAPLRYFLIAFGAGWAKAQTPRRKAKQYPMVEIVSEGRKPDENQPSLKCARKE